MSGRRSSGQGQSSLGYLFGESGELNQPDSDHHKVSSPPVTISGRGQSSLGYLFGSKDSDQQSKQESKLASPSVCVPPYGTDDAVVDLKEKLLQSSNKKDEKITPHKSYLYHKVDGDNSRDFLMTGRPSTRVTSVPGGASSLGYLFGDKRCTNDDGS